MGSCPFPDLLNQKLRDWGPKIYVLKSSPRNFNAVQSLRANALELERTENKYGNCGADWLFITDIKALKKKKNGSHRSASYQSRSVKAEHFHGSVWDPLLQLMCRTGWHLGPSFDHRRGVISNESKFIAPESLLCQSQGHDRKVVRHQDLGWGI